MRYNVPAELQLNLCVLHSALHEQDHFTKSHPLAKTMLYATIYEERQNHITGQLPTIHGVNCQVANLAPPQEEGRRGHFGGGQGQRSR